MQKEIPKISLVIPAYNEEKYIGRCLDSAIKNSDGKFFEIIVIDNASTDNTKEEVLKRKGVKIFREEKKGLVKARQRGLEEAKGDYLAFIDADTKIPEDWMDKALLFFSSDNKAVSLSGPYRYYDAPIFYKIIMNSLWWIFAPTMYRLVGYMVLGGNFIAKKSALIEMGGFDTNIEFYGEDTDIARRISKFGKSVFRMDFFIYTSYRRIKNEGVVWSNLKYALNFIWPVLFHRPFTKRYKDIRN